MMGHHLCRDKITEAKLKCSKFSVADGGMFQIGVCCFGPFYGIYTTVGVSKNIPPSAVWNSDWRMLGRLPSYTELCMEVRPQGGITEITSGPA